MKLYAQYWNWDLAGKLHEATGTDQICIIDGRYGLDRAIDVAIAYAHRLRNVRKFDGYTIHRGNLRHNVCIHSALPVCPNTTVFEQ